LKGIEYDPTAVEITKIGMSGVVAQELGARGWKTIHSAPDPSNPSETQFLISDDAARDAVKSGLLEIAETSTAGAGYAAAFIRAICADPAMPARSTIFRWLASNQEFRRSYALARDCQAEDMLDEILEIADESSRDYVKSTGVK
jgi:hypothetical protein